MMRFFFSAMWRPLRLPSAFLLGALLAPAQLAHAAVNANVAGDVLTVTGDDANDAITLRLVAGDNTQVEVLDGQVVVNTFARATFSTIVVNAAGGNDTITISDVNGVFTDTELATLNGGDGLDIITGGGGAETLDGGNLDDIVNGGPGNDTLRGGDGDDTLIGGPGADPHFGGPGSDTMVWNQGDGSDVIDGDEGNDALFFNGANANEVFALTVQLGRVFLARDLGGILMDIGTTELLRVDALDGNDAITVVDDLSLAGLLFVELDGNVGNDTLSGGPGAETLLGGAGDDILTGGAGLDFLDGGAGADTLTGGPGGTPQALEPHIGGPGNDTIVWNQGDGSDQVDGDGDVDTLIFNGAAGDEQMAAAANAGRVIFTRVQGNIVMNIGTTEALLVNALGGNDTVTIGNDVALTGLTSIRIDGGEGNDTLAGGNGLETLLGGAGNDILTGGAGLDFLDGGAGEDTLTGGPGGTPEALEPHIGGPGNDTIVWNPGDGSDLVDGDGDTDTLVFNGAAGAEQMAAFANAGRAFFTRVQGNIVMNIGTTEALVVNALGGNDTVTIGDSLVPAGLTSILIDGGDGNDTLAGGNGIETLLGGAGNDILTGGAGLDLLDGGAGDDTLTGGPGGQPQALESHIGGPGNDTIVWNPGDGSDLVNGDGDVDTLIFNGAAGDEQMAAAANAGRVLFTRVQGNIVMDIGTTEHLTVNALGGADTLTINAGLAALLDVTIDAGAGADTIRTFASSTLIVNGNADEDTLTFDAEGLVVAQRPGVIAVGATTRATHQQVEHVNLVNTRSELPAITITSPTTEPATTSSSPLITLAGTATDAARAGAVTWTTDHGARGVAVGTTNWTATDLPLQAGVTVLTVTVEDAEGNRTSDELTVTVEAFTYTMAEGSTGTFFDTDLLLANPNAVAAPVTITYLKGDGTTVRQDLSLAPTSRTTVEVDKVGGLEATELSATVTSTDALPLVVERTMRWDATGYGAHTEKATNAPQRTWYFAEGAQGFFDTFFLLANPGPVANDVTVQFLREAGAPVTRTFTLAPTSRRTIHAGGIDELKDQAFGAIVTFSEPGMAERAMYFGTPVFNAGHESAGVTAPATEWFLAEGATGTFFTTFVLVANPGDTAGTVTYTFLPEAGEAVTKTREIKPRQRLTLNIATEDASLANNAVATRVVSTVPVLAERAQYWPFTPGEWQEAHNSFGSTAVGVKWGLAEGRVGGAPRYQTFILLANANTTQAADVRITFLRADGSTVVKTATVNPETRVTFHVNTLAPELKDESFGALVEVTNGVGIFVERAMYSDAAGVVFAAGTNALGTPLP